MPELLVWQWEQAPALLRRLRLDDRSSTTTLEADDLLGTLARKEEEAGGTALILTGDRDMFQCATDAVAVLYVSTKIKGGAERIGPKEVKARYGIGPELVPDFIALRGDPSDGIPGAKGVGEKGAAELLREHGSLEALLDARAADHEAEVAHDAGRDARRARSSSRTSRPCATPAPSCRPTPGSTARRGGRPPRGSA